MKKYIKPQYEAEKVETSDIVLTSIQSQGQATLGTVTGEKGSWSNPFESLL